MLKNKIIFSLLVLLSILISYGESLAIPVAPILHTMTQPDGMTFNARPWGDENIDGWETEDGYSIVFDKAINRWTYAVYGEDGSLAWQDDTYATGTPEIFLKNSTDNGVTWTFTRVTNNSGSSFQPSVGK